jgi:hypothetical protein
MLNHLSVQRAGSMIVPPPADLALQVERALAEDIGSGDLTAALIPAAIHGRASVITREPAVICGAPTSMPASTSLDARVAANRTGRSPKARNAAADQPLLTSSRAAARALLTGERTALNFLQLLSATATAAHVGGLEHALRLGHAVALRVVDAEARSIWMISAFSANSAMVCLPVRWPISLIERTISRSIGSCRISRTKLPSIFR